MTKVETRVEGGTALIGQVWRRGTVVDTSGKTLSKSFSLPLSYKTKVLNCCGKGTERKPSTAKKGAGICAGSRTLAKGAEQEH